MTYYDGVAVCGWVLLVCCQVIQSRGEDSVALDGVLTNEARIVSRDVANIVGSSFQCPPVYRASQPHLERIVRGLDSPLRNQKCFYDSVSRRIMLLGGHSLGQESSRNVKELPGFRKVALAHELSHAWQQERVITELPENFEIDRLVFFAVLEGHAQWVTLQYAKSIDIGEAMLREQRRIQNRRIDDIDYQFVYVDGLKFWEFCVKADPQVTLKAVLTDSRISQRRIVFPDKPPTDLAVAPTWISQLTANAASSEAFSTDFVEFRKLVMSTPLLPTEQEQVNRAFEAGWSISVEGQSAGVTRLENEDGACILYKGLGAVLRKQLSRAEGRWQESKTPFIGVSIPANNSKLASRIVLIQDGCMVIEINDFRAADHQGTLKDWIETVKQRYIKARLASTGNMP